MDSRRYRRVDGIVRRDVGGELLLFDPRDDSMHLLNPTGAAIWDRLEQASTADELVTALIAAFQVGDEHDPAPDVDRMLIDLTGRGLVARESE